MHALGTGWSGTDLLQSNVVVDYGATWIVFCLDTPIREIVDRCRVWKSHSEQKRGLSPEAEVYRGREGVPSDFRESPLSMDDSLGT